MPNFGDLTAAGGGATAILAFLNMVSYGVLFLIYSNQSLLRRANADLEERNKYLEEQDERRERELVQLKADFEAVRRSFTGEVHWAALSEILTAHHEEAVAHWKNSEAQQLAIVQRLIELKERSA